MLAKLSPAALGALALFVIVVVFSIALAIMLVRATPVPEWARAIFAPLVTLLVGLVTPSPASKGGTP